MSDTILPPPLTVPIEIAGALLNLDRAAAYRYAKSGALETLSGFGRKKVAVAVLEKLVRRPITAADVEAAKARMEHRRAGYLRYQREYREARTAR